MFSIYKCCSIGGQVDVSPIVKLISEGVNEPATFANNSTSNNRKSDNNGTKKSLLSKNKKTQQQSKRKLFCELQ